MTTRFARRGIACALYATTAFCGFTAQPAAAQLPRQSEYYLGADEIDLYQGAFVHSSTDLVAGPAGHGQINFTRFHGVANSEHNHQVWVEVEPFLDPINAYPNYSYNYRLVIGRHQESFNYSYLAPFLPWPVKGGGTFTAASEHGPFTYTAGDGTVTQFPAVAAQVYAYSRAEWQEKPDGTRLTFHYDTARASPTSSWVTRLRLVSSNRGYGLGFNYLTGIGTERIHQVCAVNLAVNYATASAPCPSGSPIISYTYWSSGIGLGPVTSVTNASGQTTQYGHWMLPNGANTGQLSSIRLPGSTVDDLTIAYNSSSWKVASRSYATGETWTYAYQNNWMWHQVPHNEWTEVTDPFGKKVRHAFTMGAAPKPAAVTDELGRITAYQFVENRPHLVRKEIQPEGNYTQFTYDIRENVTETRKFPKSSSGESEIASSANFVFTPGPYYQCTHPKTCNKPTKVTDARASETDYTYDNSHGGVLTETGSAPTTGAPRPQKRFTYTQRYAWVSDGSGGYVQAATPVWLLASESFCRNSAATGNPSAPCATSGDEVLTTYDYGPNSGPNNLLLRGQVVTADGTSRRTCFTYDLRGNRIAETKPRAGLTSCP